MSERFDLPSDDLTLLRDILRAHLPPDVQVFAFGSRVQGTARRYSDLDLAIESGAALPWELITDLKQALTESDLSMKVDVIDLHAIDTGFRKRIEPELTPLPLTP